MKKGHRLGMDWCCPSIWGGEGKGGMGEVMHFLLRELYNRKGLEIFRREQGLNARGHSCTDLILLSQPQSLFPG